MNASHHTHTNVSCVLRIWTSHIICMNPSCHTKKTYISVPNCVTRLGHTCHVIFLPPSPPSKWTPSPSTSPPVTAILKPNTSQSLALARLQLRVGHPFSKSHELQIAQNSRDVASKEACHAPSRGHASPTLVVVCCIISSGSSVLHHHFLL